MPLEILTIPCLSDNYAYLIHDDKSGETALVDAPEVDPVLSTLQEKSWSLHYILITHHHYDHIDGVEVLRDKTRAKIYGAAADQHRLPVLDLAFSDGDTFQIGSEICEVMDVPGHTVGHIAYLFREAKAVFSADSLMALGCGRVFEGDFAMMWASMCKFKALPDDIQVYSGHEYTLNNARFAVTVEPDNADLQKRLADIKAKCAAGVPTLPSTIGLEKATNPMMRADVPEVKAMLGMEEATDSAVFAEIRQRKDSF